MGIPITRLSRAETLPVRKLPVQTATEPFLTRLIELAACGAAIVSLALAAYQLSELRSMTILGIADRALTEPALAAPGTAASKQ